MPHSTDPTCDPERVVRLVLGTFFMVALLMSTTIWASDGTPEDSKLYYPPANDADYVRPATTPFPAFNKPTPAKAALGEQLFHDGRLSGGNTMSCATCHQKNFGWADNIRFSLGETGVPQKRRTPHLQDIAWETSFGRDGRGESLEGFILGPISHKNIMNQSLDGLPAELAKDQAYAHLFDAAFGDPQITLGGITQSLATYMRSLNSGISPFDRWVDGDPTAISPAAKNGFELFNGKAQCAQCHTGWRFADTLFHDIGLNTEDAGRGALAPDNPLARHTFKTPTLRNVSIRAPYMHDGSMNTLRDVIDHYVGDSIDRPSRAPQVSQVDLNSQEKLYLLEFLHTLTDDTRQ